MTNDSPTHEDTAPTTPPRTSLLFIRQREYPWSLEQDEETPTDLDLDQHIVLDDVALWEAYQAACKAKQEAEDRVLNNLRKPTRAEIQEPPTPTPNELGALACFYVAERLRASRKPNPHIVTIAATSALPALAVKPSLEGEELFAVHWLDAVTPAMIEALCSKNWISQYWTSPLGDRLFSVSLRGQQWLDAAAKDLP